MGSQWDHHQAACLGTTRDFSSPSEDRLEHAQGENVPFRAGEALETRPGTILELD